MEANIFLDSIGKAADIGDPLALFPKSAERPKN